MNTEIREIKPQHLSESEKSARIKELEEQLLSDKSLLLNVLKENFDYEEIETQVTNINKVFSVTH